ncbi:tryptophan synthase subunit alpha [Jejubacter calystegiae]|uniref:tryptophan synthase n=1 Tax=Jejubacter calystegiae TaxID=2579935 RepID=A0A4P8YJN0_9ENTR|nr:tryptophan synthase subunit alpha [Jejubacter calystegiae]QCT20293.1 tryptophan synthase subunit alpha [Jejubacter calystegiae]
MDSVFCALENLPPRALCITLMAGDGGLELTRQLLSCCVRQGIAIVELCAPFPNAFTDGEVMRDAHRRALAAGVGWRDLLPLLREFSSQIHIVVLLDYSHEFSRREILPILQALRQAGAAAILPHGLPPRIRATFYQQARQAGLAVIGTLYPDSGEAIRSQVLQQSGGFIYLVSHFGRSGHQYVDPERIRREIQRLKADSTLPVALGFGLKSAADVAVAYRQGADIAIVGSLACAAIGDALNKGRDAVIALEKTLIPLVNQRGNDD